MNPNGRSKILWTTIASIRFDFRVADHEFSKIMSNKMRAKFNVLLETSI